MFKRKQKPKKLTLRQIHELYLLLHHALPKEEKKFLIDEVEYVMEHAKDGTLVESLKIMYANPPKNIDPITGLNLFIKGITENNFFSYTNFLESIKADGR